jgi:hypothetical protein
MTMPTLTEQFNELAVLMEDGLPLERELEAKVGRLISDYVAAKDKLSDTTMVPVPGGSNAAGWILLKKIYGPFDEWVRSKFRVYLTNTPRGGKPVKKAWDSLEYHLKRGDAGAARRAWDDFKPMVPKLVKLFTDEGKQVTREIKTANATYVNQKGLASATFKKYVKALDAILGALKGWRRKALGKGLKVVLAGNDAFRGRSGGRYNKASDTLFVKATPQVMKRSGGTYGAPDYILIHELGHRYDEMHWTGGKYDKPEWGTTEYSRSDSMSGSEGFAELFSLGHFGITKVRANEFASVLDRFEQEMK